MKRPCIRLLSLVAFALLLAQGVMAASKESKKAESEPFKRLTVEQVDKRLTDSNVHIYDGNNDEVYADGHIPGAIHLLSKGIKEGVLPADKATMLIFYCHSER